MTRFMIAAAVGLTMTTAASANNSAVRVDGSSVYVHYADLDLNSEAGRLQLQHRIQRGANLLCTAEGISASSLFREQCYRGARASAARQLDEIVRR